ncbi:hypothetical protein K505DRAFT_294106 [Melanomma pulvis-pyrius CBS 109.77]|uniref:Uncharacterized protein n=1 Tax=Melanomma pulvis-pyrius CBS 109.77 TaxID=1314802 RepID=A0A6A6XTF6_9PLEO|nr:hypothetical protein K505DRAFT_294106 [Melanomma pulvis-pyrius CBS 109.77]
MAQVSPTPTRVAYLRTVSHSNKDSTEIFTLLNTYMQQTSLADLENGKPRHRFLFGTANASDDHILDLLIPGEPFQGTYAHVMSRNMCRSDLELNISQTRAATLAGGAIIKRCASEGIATRINGTTDEECDSIILVESDYLIDFLTPELDFRHATWFQRYARTGQTQDNMLTNADYDVGRHDVSKMRLSNRYSGHGWQASSGAYHGNGVWRCSMCGGKCKNGKCAVGPPADRKEEYVRRAKEKEKWVDDWVKLPEKGDKRWKELTAEEMCQRFYMRKQAGLKNELNWKSVDTFSAE